MMELIKLPTMATKLWYCQQQFNSLLMTQIPKGNAHQSDAIDRVAGKNHKIVQ